MALTKEDLRQIRVVMDEAIAVHPRFAELEMRIDGKLQVMRDSILDEVADLFNVGMTMVGERFDEVDRRFDSIDLRFDRLEKRQLSS